MGQEQAWLVPRAPLAVQTPWWISQPTEDLSSGHAAGSNGQVLGLKHEWLPEPEPVQEHWGPAAANAPVSSSRSSEYLQHTHWPCPPKSKRAVEGRERGGQPQN